MAVPYVTKYVTGSIISQEYSHHVNLANIPNWTDINPNPAHAIQFVFLTATSSIWFRFWNKEKTHVSVSHNNYILFRILKR